MSLVYWLLLLSSYDGQGMQRCFWQRLVQHVMGKLGLCYQTSICYTRLQCMSCLVLTVLFTVVEVILQECSHRTYKDKADAHMLLSVSI